MHERYEKMIMKSMNVLLVGLLLLIILNIKTCSDNITVINYDGFTHECEKAGGVVNKGVCWEADVLINMTNTTDVVLETN